MAKEYDPTTDPANSSYKGANFADWPAVRSSKSAPILTTPHSYVTFFHGQNPITEPGNRRYDETKLKEIRNYANRAKSETLQGVISADPDSLFGFLSGLQQRGLTLPYFERGPVSVLRKITEDFFGYLDEVVQAGRLSSAR